MYIKIRANPGSKKEEVIEKDSTHFEIFVREEAERNMANKRIIEIVADRFGVSCGKVRIISGHHSQGKILDVDNTAA